MSKLYGIWRTKSFGPLSPQPNLALVFDDTLEWGQGGPTVAKAKAYGDRGDLLSLVTLMRNPIEVSDGEGLLHWYGILHDAVIHLGNRTYTLSLDSLSNKVAAAFSAPGPGQTGQTTRGTTSWSEDSDSVARYGTKQHLESAADRSVDEAETVRDQILKDRKLLGAIPEDGDGSFYAELLFRGLFDTLDWIFYAQSNGITSYTTSEITLFKFGRSGYPDKIAMSFEVSANGGIKSTLLPIARVGSPAGNIRVAIYSDAGAPNVEIEGVDVTATDLTTHPEQGYEFPQPNTGAYTTGTTYWLVVTPSVIGGVGDPYFMIQVSTELGYPDGSFMKYESGVWGATSPDVDMLFTVVESWDGLTRLADIVTDCGQFLTGVDNRISGGLSGNTSCPYQDGDRTGKPLIEEILQAGRSGNQPFYALVTPERELRIEEEAASTTDPVLQIDEAGYIFNRYGVPIECCQDALFKWAVLLGVADDLEQYDRYVSSNGRVFITAVEMDCATGVVRALETKAPQPASVLSSASSPREVAASIKPMVLQWMDQRGGMTHAIGGGASGDCWWLHGNAGTAPGTDFLGTIDAQVLLIYTNNTERVRINAAAAEVGIGKTAVAGNSVDTAANIHSDQNVDAGAAVTAGTNVVAQGGLYVGDDGVAIHALVMFGDDTDGTWEAIRSADTLAFLRKETGSYTGKVYMSPDGLTVGSSEAGKDYVIQVNGESNILVLTYMEDEDYLKSTSVFRGATSLFRRVVPADIGSLNPAATGATWVAPGTASGGNTSAGGWRLSDAAHLLNFSARVAADWDAASDLVVDIYFEVGLDNSAGAAGDTADLRLRCWYKQPNEVAAKSQTVEVATTVGAAGIYKAYKASFTIDYDLVANVVEAGDLIAFTLNLETDTSEVDNIVVNHVSVAYRTTHASIESGDT